ncbi:MAG: hypothetical protein GXX85_03525 [Ignavibacteria bacterium]|nr:hypothetical protein [Ignavibacteria bacterium]
MICPKCKTENEIYRAICRSCGFSLRDKVANLNLWEIFLKIVYNPSNAIKQIIWSEQKNYIIPILFLVSVKIYIEYVIIGNVVFNEKISFSFDKVFYSLLIFPATIFILSFLLKKSGFGKNTRWKDNFALFIFSYLPQVVSVIIIVPSAYAIFGKYLTDTNPYFYEVKPFQAYFIILLEAIVLFWNAFLIFLSLKIQTGKIIFSAVYSTIVLLLPRILIYLFF